MTFEQTPLAGAWLITLQPHADERGYFARTYCAREFSAHALCTAWVQHNVSQNHHAHTLRGMHWQAEPHAEIKLVRCSAGAVYDVIIDLRPDSPTFRQHYGAELSVENGRQLYIPEGFAHGFITLTDNARVDYLMSAFFEGSAARGARYNDPAFGIEWPAEPAVIHPRDAAYPDFEE